MKIPVGLSFLLAGSLAAAPAAAQVCGDYVRDPLEQCDDGNTRNLDGCDAACGFEQTHRINTLKLQRLADTVCTANAFGGALTPAGLANTQTAIDFTVANGATSILFHMSGLDDLTGTADPSLSVGVLSATPVDPTNPAYNGTSDLDWWYAADKTLLDAQRQPLHQLPGSIAGNILTAGPGSAVLKLILAGGPASLSLSNAVATVTTGASTTPASSAGAPPGHLAVEHLDPALQSYATAGLPADPDFGTLCSNISALSLKNTPIPPALIGPGCNNRYTAVNSLLDVWVRGCIFLIAPVVNATQPDQSDPAAPPVGAGPPYLLQFNATTSVVEGCLDSAMASVDLTACLADAAYSSYLKFTTDRVVAGDNRILRDSFETGDMAAWSAANTDSGDLTVDPSAAMNGGTQGLLGNINDTTGLFVEDQLPEDENRYRARFYFDPTGFDPGEINNKRRTRMFIAFEDGPRRLAAIVLRRLNGQYAVMGRARQDDNSQVNTPFFDITPGPHRVEFDWIRSSGPDANDGSFVLSLDGAVVSTLSGRDNSISSVDFVRLGALSLKVGADGTLKWDHFESNRMSATAP